MGFVLLVLDYLCFKNVVLNQLLFRVLSQSVSTHQLFSQKKVIVYCCHYVFFEGYLMFDS